MLVSLLVLISLTSCMALASTGYIDGVAVVGCGVLGTSLCQQIMGCADFQDKQGACTCFRWTNQLPLIPPRIHKFLYIFATLLI